MTTYLALARKWRPHNFDEIVGQSHVVTALRNALTHQKLHHAYLLTGTHGVGKTTLARIFAKSLNCESGITATPCGTCTHCQEIDTGRFPDLYEIDAASRTKVEDTRELLDNIPYAPTKGRFKVYLIDEVHMLSGHSFNALLKTLEEPPAHVKFLLATTDPQKLPATVLSRCLQFHLSALLPEQITQQLSHVLINEKITFEENALALLAQSASGSMRDALSLLDQSIAYCDANITAEKTQVMLGLTDQADLEKFLTAIINEDANIAFTLTKQWASQGVNFTQTIAALLSYLHELAVEKLLKPESQSNIHPEAIQLYYQIALMGQKDLPLAPTPQIGFEMMAIRMMAFKPETTALAANKTEKNEQSTIIQSKPLEKTTPPSKPAGEWADLITQLALSGPTLAFAQQCSLANMTNDNLTLHLNPKYKVLYSDRHKTRLQAALKDQFHRDMAVMIEIKQSTAQTPAEAAEQQQVAQKKSAQKALDADPTIQRMKQTFGATIIEDSVEPI